MNKLLIRDDGNEAKRWRMSALHAVHGVARKTTHTPGSTFCGLWNQSPHSRLLASLLLTQGGLNSDACPESVWSRMRGSHTSLAFSSTRSHAEGLGVTVVSGDRTQVIRVDGRYFYLLSQVSIL